MKIEIPIKLPSLANSRMHWRAMAKVKQEQRGVVAICLAGAKLPPLPATITFTRIGKRLLDDDNLAHAFKHMRDQVAAAYGVDDASSKYQWRYDQRIGKQYGVEISIEETKT